MGMACSTHGGEEEDVKDFGGTLEGKRTLGRPRHRILEKQSGMA
jgi:hypothetical protein